MALNLELVSDVVVDDVFLWDSPDFCDAHISSATYDGIMMTEEQLDELNEDRDFVHECVQRWVY